jgi:hypothetical protein
VENVQKPGAGLCNAYEYIEYKNNEINFGIQKSWQKIPSTFVICFKWELCSFDINMGLTVSSPKCYQNLFKMKLKLNIFL